MVTEACGWCALPMDTGDPVFADMPLSPITGQGGYTSVCDACVSRDDAYWEVRAQVRGWQRGVLARLGGERG